MPPRPKAEEPAEPKQEQGVGPLEDRLARVMAQTTRLKRDQTHPHFGYKYAGVESIMEAVNHALAAERVLLIPQPLTWERKESEPPRRSPTLTTFLEMNYTFRCVNEGVVEEIKVTWYSEADDQQDKGLAKVLTASRKTFLRDFFLISTGEDDPDREQAEGTLASGESRQRPQSAPRTISESQRKMLYAKMRAACGGDQAPASMVEGTLANIAAVVSKGKYSLSDWPNTKQGVDALIEWIRLYGEDPSAIEDQILGHFAQFPEHRPGSKVATDAEPDDPEGSAAATEEVAAQTRAAEAADDEDIPF